MLTKANQSRGIRGIGGISRGKGSGGSRKSGCGEGGVEGVEVSLNSEQAGKRVQQSSKRPREMYEYYDY
ncbi:hypothetical protein O988_05643 [Pseudogymnoascus sp. VKM F-3808]|nr:hypothetical protein O988_05643 [Pseudogymnoascus sp. VKM F-3808]